MEMRVIPLVLAQHAEDVAILWMQRRDAVAAPHFALRHLDRLDLRLAAHLDGLCVGQQSGAAFPRAEDAPLPGALFAEAVVILKTAPAHWPAFMERIAALGREGQEETASALGWVSAADLRGVGKALLDSPAPLQRWLGISACAFHQINPGDGLAALLEDADPAVRARAARTAGELGRLDLKPNCLALLTDPVPLVRFWAAWSAVILGDRGHALALHQTLAATPNPMQMRSLSLALRCLPLDMAYTLLQQLHKDPAQHRVVLQAAGALGEGRYLPWLIKQMTDPKWARAAGEAFAVVTGLDLAYLDLDQKRPAEYDAGPSDDPSDAAVAMDPDQDLPWPDPLKIDAWWRANAVGFTEGVRYFMGEPLNSARCTEVLRSGYQRQRLAAALHLCLLHPGTPVFNTAAPSWRQKRGLAAMQGG